MRVCVLGSGSRGHAVYVESGEDRVLFDAGFSTKELKKRLGLINVWPDSLSAAVISHEHSDHIAGLRVLGRKLPVYATSGTLDALRSRFKLNGVEKIKAGDWRALNSLRFLPIPLSHDASEPVGFVIEDDDARMALITDLGHVTRMVRHHLKDLTLAVVEANHDHNMLMNGPYRWDLKQRIKSRLGHLSNTQAKNLVADILQPGLKHVCMAHLSEINNSPAAVEGEIRLSLDGSSVALHMCSQARPLPVIEL